ncbi:ElyC/SanA/YdcF family protein [Gayadomonas joobiniege]|uniref:ElyC/SanA/YdcF family protein n=1 Tax=Gayadomonas joobiniege TaxID=1234606 RepID=UPI0003772EF6|nr:ElyC/SanA/YdcF family protein [Gayadomonas joobiniege]
MDILFAFKKLVGVLISPLPIISALFIWGVWNLYRSSANLKLARLLLTLAGCLFLLASSPLISALWINSFEKEVPVYRDHLKHVDNIIVLGCYNSEDSNLPIVANIHECSLYRLVEAKRLSLKYPQAKVVLSGMKESEQRRLSHPAYSAEFLQQLGLSRERILILDSNLDTQDEAKSLRQLSHNKINLLISSASHFRRIEKIFRREGILYTPVPSEYTSSFEIHWNWRLFLPSVSALHASERAMYESLGNLWEMFKNIDRK